MDTPEPISAGNSEIIVEYNISIVRLSESAISTACAPGFLSLCLF
jgi:hypothetical protein